MPSGRVQLEWLNVLSKTKLSLAKSSRFGDVGLEYPFCNRWSYLRLVRVIRMILQSLHAYGRSPPVRIKKANAIARGAKMRSVKIVFFMI